MVYRVVAGDNLFCLALSSVDNKDDPLSSIQQRRNIIHTCCRSTLELGHGGIFSSYFTYICRLVNSYLVSQFEFWRVCEFVCLVWKPSEKDE